MVTVMSMKFGNFLIPLFLVFSFILVVLWMLGRCRYKFFRQRKHLSQEITVALHSGIKVKLCDFVLYCCWSSNDISADIIKFYDKIYVISYQVVKETTSMDECVICKEQFDNVKQICSFKCKHCFHVTCIVKWLSEQKKCPLCWSDVKRHTPQPQTVTSSSSVQWDEQQTHQTGTTVVNINC